MQGYINWFDGEFCFLSNFYPCRVYMDDGLEYKTVEHAFQAAKTMDMGRRTEIRILGHPSDAKRAGKRLKLRPDWEDIKVEVMLQAITSKFQDGKLADRLVATAPAILVEGNHHGDRYWGVDGFGLNVLGQLLMEVRSGLMYSRQWVNK